jgi:hypothetical protein
MRMRFSNRASIFVTGLALASLLAISCGSVSGLKPDSGSPSDATTTSDGTTDTARTDSGGATGGSSGSGGATGSGGAVGTGGNAPIDAGPDAVSGTGGNSTGILLRGHITTLGAPPAPAGDIRVVNASISIPNPKMCNGTICVVSGGIVP